MLMCSFLVASTGLAAIVLAGVSLPRRMTRAGVAFFLLALAAWFLSLDLGISVFSWQIGFSLHRWFKGFTVIAHRAAWTLVPLAAVVLTAPRAGERGKPGNTVLFVVSVALAAGAAACSLSLVPAFTRAAHANGGTLWIASSLFVSLLSVAILRLDRERVARNGTRAAFILAAAIGPVLAVMPTAFRRLSLDENVVILATSLSLSVMIFVSFSVAPRASREPIAPSGHASALPAGETPMTAATTPNRDEEGGPRHSGETAFGADGIFARLSSRETEIANLLAEGKTNGEIAEALFISLKTVETHVYNIFRKTGVSNRVQLARALLSRPKG